MDKQCSLNDQISILEKIASPTTSKNSNNSVAPTEEVVVEDDTYEDAANSKATSSATKDRPKPRQVAVVPPRMLSDDKKSTVSPETSAPSNETTTRRPRGRPRKNPKPPEDEKASSQTSLEEITDGVQHSEPGCRKPAESTTSSHGQFNAYQTLLEERPPIVFPKADPTIPDSLLDSDISSMEFLKASSKLLDGKWKPLKEVDKIPEITTNGIKSGMRNVRKISDPIYSDKFEDRIKLLCKSPLYQKDSKDVVSKNDLNTVGAHLNHQLASTVVKDDAHQVKHSRSAERTPDSTERPHCNIYDNMQLAKHYEFLNRSLAKSISKNLDATGVCKEEQQQHYQHQQRKISDSSPPVLMPYHHNHNNHLTHHHLPHPVEPGECDVPLFTLPALSSSYPVNLLPNISNDSKSTHAITCNTATKSKRGRKRKVDANVTATSSSNIIVPGKHTKANKRKDSTTKQLPLTAAAPTLESNPKFEKDIEKHFSSPYGKYYMTLPAVSKELPLLQTQERVVSNQQQQKQSVITANPVNLPHHITYPQYSTVYLQPSTSNFHLPAHAATTNSFQQSGSLERMAHVVVPPPVPSHSQVNAAPTSSSRTSSLDILKQAAVAGLPPDIKMNHPPIPYYPLSSQPNKSDVIPGVGASIDKNFLPNSTSKPAQLLQTSTPSFFALHNHVIEQASSSPASQQQLKQKQKRKGSGDSSRHIVSNPSSSIAHAESLTTATRPKKSKKEKKSTPTTVPIFLPGSILTGAGGSLPHRAFLPAPQGGVPPATGDILRTMLLPNALSGSVPQAPQQIILLNSATSTRPHHSKTKFEPKQPQQLMCRIPTEHIITSSAFSPSHQKLHPHAPLVILPVSGVATTTTAGKSPASSGSTPHSSIVSPTFPPSKH